MICDRCDGEGVIEVGSGDDSHSEPCPDCRDVDYDSREPDEDDGSTYADPRDEMDDRLRE